MQEYRDYTVTLRFQFPAWDEMDGIPFHLSARNKSEAVRQTRKLAARDGHTPARGKGRATFTAVLTA